jgi:hypothetical protein
MLLATLSAGAAEAGSSRAEFAHPSGAWGTAEVEMQSRRAGTSAVARLAVPFWSTPLHSNLIQATIAKGEQSSRAASVGLIERFRPGGGEWVLGFHGFYEAQETPEGFSLQQITAGAEVSHGPHLVRADGWLPFTGADTRTRHDGSTETTSPTKGFEAEYEFTLPKLGREITPRVAAGYYYLTAAHSESGKVSGFKVRGELEYRWLSAGLEWREDARAFGGNWLATARVSIPLGHGYPAASSAPNDPMLTPIRRDIWPRTLRTSHAAPPTAREERAPVAAAQVRFPAPSKADPYCCGGAPDSLTYD